MPAGCTPEPAPSYCRKAGGDLEQIQLLLGHASIQTTERYLGTEQALAHAVNDAIATGLGSAEILVADQSGTLYPAPNHICHYVAEHS